MELSFKNKVVIVTGSSSGIGRATAIAFAKRGAKVALVDWNTDVDTEKTIKTNGGEAIFIKCDISKEDQVQQMVQQTVAHFGRLDAAFNNAGVEGDVAIATECSNDNWERVLGVNLTGTWYCMKHQIPEMIKSGGGAIVNTASIAGILGSPNVPAYVTSKHGIVGLTRNAALDYAKQNVRINAVCPGPTHTSMIDRFLEVDASFLPLMEAATPIGRLGKPEEIAEAVVFLCSEGASFIIGQAIAVDGGWSIQ